MDAHARNVLEFDRLLSVVARYANTESGREAIHGLMPARTERAAQSERALYADLLGLRGQGTHVAGILFQSIEDVLRRVAPSHAVVGGEDLVRVRSVLESAGRLLRFLRGDDCRGWPALSRLRGRLVLCRELLEDLTRSLDENGRLLDAASPRLADLRRQRRLLEERVRDSLQALLHDTEVGDAFQDRFVTVRNGRYVVPVRREAKSRVPGIVHDHSDSGKTVFVEPSRFLPLGNDLADTSLEERDECRRILAALSDRVRAEADTLRSNQQLLTRFDAASAVTAWAQEFECLLPTFGSRLQLYGARHPLLAAQFRRQGAEGAVVPLDFAPAETVRCVVVTGSNSGGKTVALKTIGLLALAAQAGLPVPVDKRSVFPVFEQVFADIGDEQSLQQNLSTFTGHMRFSGTFSKPAPGPLPPRTWGA